jgi:ABC-type polysaccharide/polyol phosphate transport system ATPase subunit
VIRVEDVGKKFRIWEDRSRDLKETAVNFLKGKKRSYRELWALRGIDLEIGGGETVAFIGENGSGKSTLLKLLCGIYVPDEGRVIVRERSPPPGIGVGFHPDLTGKKHLSQWRDAWIQPTKMRKRFVNRLFRRGLYLFAHPDILFWHGNAPQVSVPSVSIRTF